MFSCNINQYNNSSYVTEQVFSWFKNWNCIERYTLKFYSHSCLHSCSLTPWMATIFISSLSFQDIYTNTGKYKYTFLFPSPWKKKNYIVSSFPHLAFLNQFILEIFPLHYKEIVLILFLYCSVPLCGYHIIYSTSALSGCFQSIFLSDTFPIYLRLLYQVN